MSACSRNHVQVKGQGERAMVFAHGFGCDQNMWRHVAPAFERDFKTVLFDHVGAGRSDLSAYETAKYASLSRYAADLVEIGHELELTNAVFVGHSVSSMIGILASLEAPELFESLVLIGPSPRYIDDGAYVGGFAEAQIGELLDFLESNHMGWSSAMAPVIMGNPDRPELGGGTDRQLLQNRSGDRERFCPCHLHLGQPRRFVESQKAYTDPAMQRRCYRPDRGRRLCTSQHRGQRVCATRRDRSLPQSQRA